MTQDCESWVVVSRTCRPQQVEWPLSGMEERRTRDCRVSARPGLKMPEGGLSGGLHQRHRMVPHSWQSWVRFR